MKKKLYPLLLATACLFFTTRSFADVTYSTQTLAAGNVTQGSLDNIIYIVKVDVTTTAVTSASIQFILTGTHDANDLVSVSVYTNTTPSLTGATNRGGGVATFAAPHAYNINYVDFSIAAGTTLYFIIVIDVSATGTGGNTIKIDGAANPVTFTYTAAPTIINNQTDAAGVKTIQVAGVTYSSEPVTGGNVAQSSINNIVYIAKLDVTDLPVTNAAMQFTLTGTHDANDLTSVAVYTNTTPSLTGATNRGGGVATFAAPHAYNINYIDFSMPAGSTLYFIVVVDVSATGTGGNTIKINGVANPVAFTYTTGPTITNNQTDVTGVKTIQAAGVTYSSEPVTGGNVAQSSINNIVYIAKLDVTDLPVTNAAMQFTLTGTHDANDLTSVAVYTNTTPSLTGATNRGGGVATFAAPHAYNINYIDFSMPAGSTLYFIVVVDVSATGTSGNTIKIDGVANPVAFTYTTGPTITNNQTDMTGVKTIQAAGVTYSSEPVIGGNVAQSSINNIVYIAKLDVTDLPVTNTAMQFTLTGTHDANDLVTVSVYTNTTPSLTGATNRGGGVATFAAPHAYNINYTDFSMPAGSTLYFIVVVDVSATGTGGNTIKINGVANPVAFTYSTAPPITNNQTDVAGIKTIQAAGITLSSETIASSNIIPGSSNNIIYITKMDVTTLPVSVTDIQFTLSGTHDADDLTTVEIFTNSTPTLAGATSTGSFAATFAAPHVYNLNISDVAIAAGINRYFIIAVDLNAGATITNTIKLDGLVNPVTFSYTTSPSITNSQTDAAGVKTIGSTLPLTLLGFTGSIINTQQVQLRWTTAGEEKTKEFDVEWSTDGIQFSKTGVILAAGNSTQNREYNYIHRLPADGINYYRLKMKDIDGRFTYSPVITVNISITTFKISAYPNPVVDLLNIRVQAVKNETMVLDLFNAEGKIIASRSVILTKGTNQFNWNIQSIPAGNYFVGDGNRSFETIKIIKQ